MAKSKRLLANTQRIEKLTGDIFKQYKQEISREVLNQYGTGIINLDNPGFDWRHKIPFSQEILEFIYFRSRVFMTSMGGVDSIYKNPKFLNMLVRNIADHIATYACKQELKYGETLRDAKVNRTPYSHQIYEILYTNNALLQKRINDYKDELIRKRNVKQYRKRKNKQKTAHVQKCTDRLVQEQNKLHSYRDIIQLKILIYGKEGR